MTKKYRTVGVDLYSEVLRHLARAIIIFNFENAGVGEEKINYALEILEEFGGKKIKEFYQNKMEKYLNSSKEIFFILEHILEGEDRLSEAL